MTTIHIAMHIPSNNKKTQQKLLQRQGIVDHVFPIKSFEAARIEPKEIYGLSPPMNILELMILLLMEMWNDRVTVQNINTERSGRPNSGGGTHSATRQ